VARHIFGPSGEGAESSNHAGNPLRSYRMSMLAHGFVDQSDADQSDRAEFALDESDPMSYGVVRTRGGSIGGLLLAGAILVAVAAVVIILG
jgi:hypothetical protein